MSRSRVPTRVTADVATASRWLCLLAALIFVSSSSPISAQARELDGGSPSVAAEPRVKAELIERFTRFIRWPEGRLPKPELPFVLCLAGADAMIEPHLKELARTRTVRGHKLEIVRPASLEGLHSCHAVWVPRGSSARLKEILAMTRGRPILTLGDTKGFANDGVLINMTRTPAGRVAFEINLDEARKSGLRFSSKLLRLGQIVGPDKGLQP